MSIETLGFWVLAAAAVACAVGMVSAKNPIHAALWLVGNFVSLAVIYLVLSAPMLFAFQLIVYAGAIMVLFLFVVMFFMAPEARQWLRPPLQGQLFFGGIAAVALLGLLVWSMADSGADIGYADPVLQREYDRVVETQADGRSARLNSVRSIAPMGHPKQLGNWLFSYQVLPFELTSLLLLAALLGAMLVARDMHDEGRGRRVNYAPRVRRREQREEPELSGEAAEVQA